MNSLAGIATSFGLGAYGAAVRVLIIASSPRIPDHSNAAAQGAAVLGSQQRWNCSHLDTARNTSARWSGIDCHAGAPCAMSAPGLPEWAGGSELALTKMDLDELARVLAISIARHQSRGLVDDANGVTDVVIHGRVNLRAVAKDVRGAVLTDGNPPRRSWAAWFIAEVDDRRRARRSSRNRNQSIEQLRSRLLAAD
jgi:hypothetical protein